MIKVANIPNSKNNCLSNYYVPLPRFFLPYICWCYSVWVPVCSQLCVTSAFYVSWFKNKTKKPLSYLMLLVLNPTLSYVNIVNAVFFVCFYLKGFVIFSLS